MIGCYSGMMPTKPATQSSYPYYEQLLLQHDCTPWQRVRTHSLIRRGICSKNTQLNYKAFLGRLHTYPCMHPMHPFTHYHVCKFSNLAAKQPELPANCPPNGEFLPRCTCIVRVALSPSYVHWLLNVMLEDTGTLLRECTHNDGKLLAHSRQFAMHSKQVILQVHTELHELCQGGKTCQLQQQREENLIALCSYAAHAL
jgi:hypothetical protein